ncbi:MAG: deoxyribodipyrimidine photo-lyase [Bdellovibrionaceae bacterium]|nr:deoxyribodipyrimidine photo-lyase [Pseudobdellovibrionaceae bacterium]
MEKLTIFWFRRDLRLKDNHGLFRALAEGRNVQPIFIFDTEILSRLEDKDDARVSFLFETLADLKARLQEKGSDLWIYHGTPLGIWRKIVADHRVGAVYANRDYEPEALRRDESVRKFLETQGIPFHLSKDQCLFETDEILSGQGTPYTVFTPYKKRVLSILTEKDLKAFPSDKQESSFHRGGATDMISLKSLGFEPSSIAIPERKILKSVLSDYAKTRDFPAQAKGTSRLGLHLRFGTLSVRELARVARELKAETYLSELIWRDFFMQILWHFPRVQTQSFREAYDRIKWRSSRSDFQRWCAGETGYPWVDAGMRELNATGFMHNRVRMATASFLSKHLLIHWSEGERYFARRLLDYDLAANNGNWQWAAGTGCDAAPYFRVFNPSLQAKKFDPDGEYVRRWVPELGTAKYPKPMVDHDEARGRALSEYSKALKGKSP